MQRFPHSRKPGRKFQDSDPDQVGEGDDNYGMHPSYDAKSAVKSELKTVVGFTS